MVPQPISRRQFFSGSRAAVHVRVCPPGTSIEKLIEACSGCGLCEERCPTGIIRLTDGLPFVDFTLGECTFCDECRQACPEPVFSSAHLEQFPHVAVIGAECLAKRNIACQSCGEACPLQAIRFRPRIGGPFVPELDFDVCSGCGGCIGICPVGAIAIEPRSMEETDA
ncbi:ferredoxin-type protein NapF [Rhizobium tibeticum]|uniref:Ferredoxin-type protein NapF n=1 Tax=Rhizobium tibeticum TaxID=501024 RepID=A0A1H8L6U5_9HYPH|nr:ferredoxin-type protein NapF [Rhizobium tibeticum]SEH86768.1 ferredoxin-type protein [Rhizobium tibeticum]SEO00930.1 ferredoxin-type protein NapF [Rhizobium tibeticum]